MYRQEKTSQYKQVGEERVVKKREESTENLGELLQRSWMKDN